MTERKLKRYNRIAGSRFQLAGTFFCRAFPKTNFVIDESYLTFVNSADHESMIGRGLPNVIVLNSMSKIFRISGLRIGFIIASKDIIEKLTRYSLPWSVNALAQVAVRYLMDHEAEINAFIDHTQKLIEKDFRIVLSGFR